MFIIYGSKKSYIKGYDPFMYKCPYCEEQNTTSINIYSKYYHIFWVPVFPFDKEGIATCNNCDAMRGEEKFGPILTSKFKEVTNKMKHPFYTYTLTALLIFFIVFIIIVAPK